MVLRKLSSPTVRRDVSLWIFLIGFISSMGLITLNGWGWIAAVVFMISLGAMVSAVIHQQLFDVDGIMGEGLRDD